MQTIYLGASSKQPAFSSIILSNKNILRCVRKCSSSYRNRACLNNACWYLLEHLSRFWGSSEILRRMAELCPLISCCRRVGYPSSTDLTRPKPAWQYLFIGLRLRLANRKLQGEEARVIKWKHMLCFTCAKNIFSGLLWWIRRVWTSELFKHKQKKYCSLYWKLTELYRVRHIWLFCASLHLTSWLRCVESWQSSHVLLRQDEYMRWLPTEKRLENIVVEKGVILCKNSWQYWNCFGNKYGVIVLAFGVSDIPLQLQSGFY